MQVHPTSPCPSQSSLQRRFGAGRRSTVPIRWADGIVALLLLWLPALHGQSVTLINFTNSIWAYDDTTTAGANYHGFGWQSPAFNASGWKTGMPLFGNDGAGIYDAPGQPFSGGINGFVTPLDRSGGRVTFYFRTTFNWPQGQPTAGVTLHSTNYVDDGCVIYLNGQEAGRIRLPIPPATIAWDTPAENPSTEGLPAYLELPATQLVTGENLLAVEVHQSGTFSADVAWAMKLVAVLPPTTPVIAIQPESQTNSVGDTVVFSVAASGAAPLSYRWHFNATNAISGATNASLSLTNLQLIQAGRYSVVISNAYGSATSLLAELAVLLPPGPTPHIRSISMPVNGCNSPCRPLYDNIWSVASPPYPLNTSNGIGIIIDPQFVAANVNTDFALHENGNYAGSHVPQPLRAVVTYQFDQPAVVNQLEIIQHFYGLTQVEAFVGDDPGSLISIGSVFGPAGDITDTVVGADGDSHVFQFNNGIPGRYFRFIVRKTAHSSAFAIHRAIPRDASGQRYRRVSGPSDPPLISSGPIDRILYRGADVSFTVAVDGTPPIELQWRFMGTDIPGATNPVYHMMNAQGGNAGTYEVMAINPHGSVTGTVATLTVLPCLPSPPNALAWYRAEGDMSDTIRAGPGNGAVARGTVTFERAVVGNGFRLSDSSIRLPGPYSFSESNAATLQCWFKLDAFGSGPSYYSGLMSAEGCCPYRIYVAPTGRVYFNPGTHTDHFVDYPIVLGQFHHVAMVVQGGVDGMAKLYMDGSLVIQTNGGVPAVLPGAANFLLGSGEEAFYHVMTNGVIDEAAVYNRALTSNEIAAIFLAGSAGMCAPQCTAPPPGFLSWWSGDGNAADTEGNHHGIAVNGAGFGPGKVGTAFAFDGLNDRIEFPGTEPLAFGTNLTVQAWIYPTGSIGRIVDKITVNSPDGFLLDLGAGILRWAIGAQPYAYSVSSIPTHAWSHVVGVYDGQFVRLYVNGQLESASPASGAAVPTSQNLIRLGNDSLGTFAFAGLIDEVAIHNRALSSNEVAAIYAAGSAGMCKPPLQTRVNGMLATSAVTVTNSGVVSMQTAFANGAIFYTVDGAQPGGGTLYAGPFVMSTSVVVRAIAYNADYTESAELNPTTVTVVHLPVILQPPQTQTVLSGQPAVFAVQAGGDGPLSYQWFFNGAPLVGANASSFARDGALLSEAGSYWVVVSNAYGRATSMVAGLTVLLRPSIASQPMSTNVNSGQNATFCVSAIGSAPLAFQWRKNGVNIPGATNACLPITNVQATNAGAYSVVVGNGADAVTSAEAVLVLADLPNGPPAEDDFDNRNGLSGNSGALEVNNVGATKEPGEPAHAGKPGGSSVWYAWTPANAGIATLRTSGSAFDTLLAVYRGDDVAALTLLAANEDGGGFLTSEVRFNATNGVQYQIAVDGFAAAQGSFVLSWNLEPTAQLLPVISAPPVSQTVTQGATTTFNVSAGGNGLTYQWYFNGARLNNATNSSVTRSNVQPADVGYYAVAVTNSQSRGLLSEAAVLEIGPFADVRSVDKVEDLLGGPQPFQPASAGAASVAIGTLGTQVLNTTNSTTSFRETNHCGVIGGSSRWFKLKPAANGLMSVDTFGSTFDTVLAAYTGNAQLGGYPTKLIDCDDNAATDVRWSRVLYPATNAIDYLIAVDGAGAASGTVQLNWSLGLPPVIVSNPPASNPLVGEGDLLRLTTALTNGLPPPKLQWYLNGAPITDATNATYQVGAAQRTSGGIYTVVAYNPVGAVTSVVANVSIEVPLELHLQPVAQNGKVHFRVSGVASQTFILQGSTNFLHWQPLYTNATAGAPVSYDDHSTTNRSRRYYRALPWP